MEVGGEDAGGLEGHFSSFPFCFCCFTRVEWFYQTNGKLVNEETKSRCELDQWVGCFMSCSSFACGSLSARASTRVHVTI